MRLRLSASIRLITFGGAAMGRGVFARRRTVPLLGLVGEALRLALTRASTFCGSMCFERGSIRSFQSGDPSSLAQVFDRDLRQIKMITQCDHPTAPGSAQSIPTIIYNAKRARVTLRGAHHHAKRPRGRRCAPGNRGSPGILFGSMGSKSGVAGSSARYSASITRDHSGGIGTANTRTQCRGGERRAPDGVSLSGRVGADTCVSAAAARAGRRTIRYPRRRQPTPGATPMSDLRLLNNVHRHSVVPEEDCAAFVAIFDSRIPGLVQEQEIRDRSNARTRFARDIAKANP
jgi:hypothetical protein